MASFKDFLRFCNNRQDCCHCPLNPCYGEFGMRKYEKNNAIIDEWCKKFPIKTYAADFLERFPNAILAEDNKTPHACREDIYGRDDTISCTAMTCKDCWNREVKKRDK